MNSDNAGATEEKFFIPLIKKHFRTISACAKKLSITSQAISQWEEVPPKRAEELELLTRGKVKYAQWRPRKKG